MLREERAALEARGSYRTRLHGSLHEHTDDSASALSTGDKEGIKNYKRELRPCICQTVSKA